MSRTLTLLKKVNLAAEHIEASTDQKAKRDFRGWANPDHKTMTSRQIHADFVHAFLSAYIIFTTHDNTF